MFVCGYMWEKERVCVCMCVCVCVRVCVRVRARALENAINRGPFHRKLPSNRGRTCNDRDCDTWFSPYKIYDVV